MAYIMKSPQNDKVAMTCKGCKFTKRVGNLQIGCTAKRIKSFKERQECLVIKEETGTLYGLTRLCNLYRDKDAEITLAEAQDQIKPTFGIAIYDEGTPGKVEKTISSILDAQYPPDKIKVIISSFTAKDVSKMTHLINTLIDNGFKNSKLVLTGVKEAEVRDFSCFSNLYGSNYLIKLHAGDIINADLFSKINISLNHDLDKNIIFKQQDTVCSLFSAINSEYMIHNDFDKTVESIESMAQLSNMVKVV